MKKSLTTVIVVSIVFVSMLFLSACQEKVLVDGKYAAVAKCLTEKGVKFYGAYWCAHCQNQKKAFGDDMRYITYVECDPAGKNADPEACIEAGVEGYPTWYFPGQGLETGEQKIETLAQKANCQDALAISPDSGQSATTPIQADTSDPAGDNPVVENVAPVEDAVELPADASKIETPVT